MTQLIELFPGVHVNKTLNTVLNDYYTDRARIMIYDEAFPIFDSENFTDYLLPDDDMHNHMARFIDYVDYNLKLHIDLSLKYPNKSFPFNWNLPAATYDMQTLIDSYRALQFPRKPIKFLNCHGFEFEDNSCPIIYDLDDSLCIDFYCDPNFYEMTLIKPLNSCFFDVSVDVFAQGNSEPRNKNIAPNVDIFENGKCICVPLSYCFNQRISTVYGSPGLSEFIYDVRNDQMYISLDDDDDDFIFDNDFDDDSDDDDEIQPIRLYLKTIRKIIHAQLELSYRNPDSDYKIDEQQLSLIYKQLDYKDDDIIFARSAEMSPCMSKMCSTFDVSSCYLESIHYVEYSVNGTTYALTFHRDWHFHNKFFLTALTDPPIVSQGFSDYLNTGLISVMTGSFKQLQVDELIDSANKVVSDVDALTRKVDDSVEKAKNAVDYSKIVSNFILSMLTLVHNGIDSTNIVLELSKMLISSNVLSDFVISQFIKVLRHVIDFEYKGIQAQGLTDNPLNSLKDFAASFDLVKHLTPVCKFAGCIAVFAMTIVNGAIPNFCTITSFMKNFIQIGQFCRAANNIWDFLVTATDHGIKTMYDMITGGYDPVNINNFLPGYEQWMIEVSKYNKFEITDQLPVKKNDCDKIQDLYFQGLSYYTNIKDMTDASKIIGSATLTSINVHFQIVKKLYDKVDRSGCGSRQNRIEPIVIRMSGQPGCGKSNLTKLLCVDLVAHSGRQGRWEDHVYNRCIVEGNDFWTSYRQQLITVYDDFDQNVDSQTKQNKEYMEIIRAKNCTPFDTNQASLEDKGKWPFTSRILLLSTNVTKHQPKSIKFADALTRRFDINVDVKVKPQYATTVGSKSIGVDTSKVAKAGGLQIKPEIYDFDIEFASPAGRQQVTGVDYDDLLAICKERYDSFTNNAQSVNEELKERFDAQLKLRAQGDLELTEAQTLLLNFYESDSMEIRDFLNVEDVLAEEINKAKVEDKLFYMISGTPEYGSYAFAEKYAAQIDVDTTVQKCLKIIKNAYNKVVSSPYLGFALAIPTFLGLLSYLFATKTTECSAKSQIKFLIFDECYYDKVNIIVGKCGCERCTSFIKYMSKLESEKYDGGIEFNMIQCWITYYYFFLFRRYSSKDALIKIEAFNYNSLCPNYMIEHAYSCYCSIFKSENYSSDKTLKTPKIHTESYESGRTTKTPKIRTEAYENGRTTKTPKIRTENRVVIKADVAEKFDTDIYDIDARGQKEFLYAQALSDQNADEIISHTVARNLYRLSVSDENTTNYIHVLFVRGRIAITCKHQQLSWRNAPDTAQLVNAFMPHGLDVNFSEIEQIDPAKINTDNMNDVDKAKIRAMQEKDLLILVFPSYIPSAKCIVDKFVKTEDLQYLTPCDGTLLTTRFYGSNKNVVSTYAHFNLRDVQSKNENLTYWTSQNMKDINSTEHKIVIRKYYSYRAETKAGDCGTPLILTEKSKPRKIFGLHVAGGVGCGMANSITQEDLDLILPTMCARGAVTIKMPKEFIEDHIEPFVPNTITHGYVKDAPGRAISTAIMPSLIHGKVTEPTTKPAFLKNVKTPDGIVNPMTKALQNIGIKGTLVNPKHLEIAKNDIINIMKQKRRPETARVLTFDEAVQGVEGEEYLAPVNRRSSPGFPWVLKRTGIGKTQWLGDGEYEIDEEIRNLVNERIHSARKNIREVCFWTDTLKDERRPIAKVDAIKTRVFSASEMTYLLAARMYFLGFAAHMMENRIGNGCAIGINPYSIEWTKLAFHLKSKGNKVIAADFSRYDASISAQLLWAVCDIINAFYDDNNDQIRDILFEEVVNSFHICEGKVYQWPKSEPSGFMLTTPLNCIVNLLLIRLCWLDIFDGTENFPMSVFNEEVSFTCYGDDSVTNISDRVIFFFNQESITKSMDKLGMVYTDENKTGTVVPYRCLDEVDFLKRKFFFDIEGRYYAAPLSLTTCTEMMNWVRNGEPISVATNHNILNALAEIAIHGKETYEYYKKLVEKATKDLDYPPMIPSFYEQQMTLALQRDG